MEWLPDIIQRAITENVQQTMHHPSLHADIQWKTRSVYWERVLFTRVNMCIPGWWRVDGSAVAWHLIYGCIQGEGRSRPPPSLIQIISPPGRNKWCLLASFNKLSHIFILFIYCEAILSLCCEACWHLRGFALMSWSKDRKRLLHDCSLLYSV